MDDPLLLISGALGLVAFAFGAAWKRHTLSQNVGRHQKRRRILDELGRDPGASLREICDRLGLRRGTAAHHLFILERAGVIASHHAAGNSRFFPPMPSAQERAGLAALRRPKATQLLARVMEHPGIRQDQLLSEVGLTRKSWRRMRPELQRGELVREERMGRTRHYHPTPQLERLMLRLPPEPLRRPPEAGPLGNTSPSGPVPP